MYQAKKDGRNGLRFFDPEMQATLEKHSALENSLHRALQRRQLHLYYQMQVTSSRRVIGAEALLRWEHPDHGLITPDQFIPLAEETGLIVPIGLWVLQTACAQIAEWADNPATSELQLAINVSARQFRQPDFVEQVQQALDTYRINPARLKIELTESLVLDNISDTIARMHALKASGISFSMDDFGTGYSSLTYLKQLPLDQLKIDRSFVRDVVSDPSDAAIVKAIITLGQTFGLHVIAEGVETTAQHEFLEQHGCDAYQGYLFSKPVPIEEFNLLMR
jgi:EAL domain-containing protein (putative c-di-GMP-specific phosphodiesterase class I)